MNFWGYYFQYHQEWNWFGSYLQRIPIYSIHKFIFRNSAITSRISLKELRDSQKFSELQVNRTVDELDDFLAGDNNSITPSWYVKQVPFPEEYIFTKIWVTLPIRVSYVHSSNDLFILYQRDNVIENPGWRWITM